MGLGAGEMGVLFVFSDHAVFEKFIKGKWGSGGGVEATAKSSEHGGGMEGSVSTQSGVDVYQVTESGISYGATWQ